MWKVLAVLLLLGASAGLFRVGRLAKKAAIESASCADPTPSRRGGRAELDAWAEPDRPRSCRPRDLLPSFFLFCRVSWRGGEAGAGEPSRVSALRAVAARFRSPSL